MNSPSVVFLQLAGHTSVSWLRSLTSKTSHIKRIKHVSITNSRRCCLVSSRGPLRSWAVGRSLTSARFSTPSVWESRWKKHSMSRPAPNPKTDFCLDCTKQPRYQSLMENYKLHNNQAKLNTSHQRAPESPVDRTARAAWPHATWQTGSCPFLITTLQHFKRTSVAMIIHEFLVIIHAVMG